MNIRWQVKSVGETFQVVHQMTFLPRKLFVGKLYKSYLFVLGRTFEKRSRVAEIEDAFGRLQLHFHRAAEVVDDVFDDRTSLDVVDFVAVSVFVKVLEVLAVFEHLQVVAAEGGAPGRQLLRTPRLVEAAHQVHHVHFG